jgi:hypothetical protein
VCLIEVFRQAALSRIITAHRINQDSILDLSLPGPDSDFYFVRADDPSQHAPTPPTDRRGAVQETDLSRSG